MLRQMGGMAVHRLPRYELVGDASNAAEANALLISADPDVAILDLGLPDESGLDLARRALSDAPNLRIPAITARRDTCAVRATLDTGILRFVSKGEAHAILIAALNQLADGLPFYSPAALKLLRGGLNQPNDDVKLLTPRERDIVCESARGFTVKEISHRLDISENTHRKNVLQKLNLHDVVALTHFAVRHGLVSV